MHLLPMHLLAPLPRLLLLALLVAPAAARVSDEEMRDLKAQFSRVAGEADPDKRIAIIAKLGLCDHPEAVKLLIRLLGSVDPAYEPTVQERHRALVELEEFIKVLIKYNGKTISVGEANRLNAKKAELEAKVLEFDRRLTAFNFLRYTSIEALYNTKDAEAIQLLHDAAGDGKWEVRTGVLMALGRCGTKDSRPIVRKAMGDKDPKVQSVAIDAAVLLEMRDASAAIAAELGNKAWQVRQAAARALGQFKSLDSVEALVTALDGEEGRVREDIDEALQRITGYSFGGDANSWKAWYAGNKDRLAEVVRDRLAQARLERVKGHSITTFYGIETLSKNLCFVIDVSGSMAQKAGRATTDPPPGGATPITGGGQGTPPANPGGDPATGAEKEPPVPLPPPVETDPNYPVDGTKMEVANYELTRAVKALPPDALFNIVYFSTTVSVYNPSAMIKASDRAKDQTVAWIKQTLKPDQMTNIFDALEKALMLSGPRLDPNYAKGVDTVFFLTDGVPTHGRVRDPAKVLTEIGMINQIRKVKIHVIGVGKEPEIDLKFLKALAEQNGGQFVHRE